MTEILSAIAKLSGLVFVVAIMLAMGLSLTIPQIVRPLKNVKLLILALAANFILFPAAAYVIVAVMPRISSFSEANGIAFILLATAAGIVFYLIALGIGYALAFGADREIKSVMALGAGQRNLSAAFVVAAGNFAGNPDVIITLIVLAIVNLVLLLPLAGEMGKRV